MTTLTYTLNDFNNITNIGFDYTISPEIINIINSLSAQVGSPLYNKNPVFKKKDIVETDCNANRTNKKRKGNVEINDEDWDSIRSFQPTKLDEKIGINLILDQIRSCLNKLTDKSYNDVKVKMNGILSDTNIDLNEQNILKMGQLIFDILSTNKFYSEIYASLFIELMNAYDWLTLVLTTNYNVYISQFDNITYIDPEENYDAFCDLNKLNERRKSISLFFVNVAIKESISKNSIIQTLQTLIDRVFTLIELDNNKVIVDELIENIALIYNNKLIHNSDAKTIAIFEYCSNKICLLSKMKAKNYKSLTNKSVFKCMDLQS